jgi:multiple sugar transport system substrate-binding protein
MAIELVVTKQASAKQASQQAQAASIAELKRAGINV